MYLLFILHIASFFIEWNNIGVLLLYKFVSFNFVIL